MHRFKKWYGLNRDDENGKCRLTSRTRQARSRNMMLHWRLGRTRTCATVDLTKRRPAAAARLSIACTTSRNNVMKSEQQMHTDTADADANDLEAGNVHEEEQHRQPPDPEERPASAPAPSTRRRSQDARAE